MFHSQVGVAESPYGCYVVNLGLDLNHVQELGMGQTQNVLDKHSVEPHNKIRVVGEPAIHILKSIGREGVA